MAAMVCAALVFCVGRGTGAGIVQAQSARPNIVLIFPDNLGWGEVGAYGTVRGQLTPRIDKLAAEGIRLNNFNVEFSCTVSRAALLTGRYAIRTGATQASGITLWEVTIAEALKSVGYATALFGKWHLGGDRPEGRREPTHQGFDEFYGIPRTSNEAQTTIAHGQTTPGTSFIWEGRDRRAGAQREAVRPRHAAHRRSRIGRARHRVHGAQRRARAQPFFLYYPMTQIHFPTLAHPDFAGKTGAGDIGDAMAEVDHNVGLRARRDRSAVRSAQHHRDLVHRQRRRAAAAVARIVRAVDRLLQHRHGRRHPHAVHHPLAGRIPAGRVSNEIVHQIDLFPTLAAAVGRRHRPEGSRDRRREPAAVPRRQAGQVEPRHVLFFANTQLRAVKWRDWKLHYSYQPEPGAAPVPPLMRLFNLLSDPQGRVRHQGRQSVGAGGDGQARRAVHGDDRALSARAAERADPYVPPKRN